MSVLEMQQLVQLVKSQPLYSTIIIVMTLVQVAHIRHLLLIVHVDDNSFFLFIINKACQTPCTECSGTALTCTSCAFPTPFLYSNNCIDSCPSNTFESSTTCSGIINQLKILLKNWRLSNSMRDMLWRHNLFNLFNFKPIFLQPKLLFKLSSRHLWWFTSYLWK